MMNFSKIFEIFFDVVVVCVSVLCGVRMCLHDENYKKIENFRFFCVCGCVCECLM